MHMKYLNRIKEAHFHWLHIGSTIPEIIGYFRPIMSPHLAMLSENGKRKTISLRRIDCLIPQLRILINNVWLIMKQKYQGIRVFQN